MLDNLPAMATFAKIVAEGSLSAAARSMDLPLSVISKRLAQLEEATGVKLLERTTRRQTVTQEGAIFYERVLRILDEVNLAEAELHHQRQVVGGVLRVTAPFEFGRLKVVPLLAQFHLLYPQLTIELGLSDTLWDLNESGYDLGLRFGNLPDSGLVARKIADNFRVACASPAYLARFGEPTHPSELSQHKCILMGEQPRADWKFIGKINHTVRVTGAVITNDGGAALEFALQGAGIAVKSIFDIEEDLASCRLKIVLPFCSMPSAPLYAVYQSSHQLAPRVRTFVDFFRANLQPLCHRP